MKYLLLLIAFLSSCTTTIPVVEESINCPSQLIEKTPLKATDLPCTDLSKPKPPIGVLYAWMLPDNKWKNTNITVKFLNGNQWQICETWKCFKEWETILGGKVKFIPTKDNANIRVRFGSGGHWSYLGEDNLDIPQNYQTMNLQFSANENREEIQRVARHEIGHALNLQHEHQSPRDGLVWNEKAAIDYYMRTQGWSREQVMEQVINKYKGDKYRATEVDPNSTMMYPIPKGLANIVVGWNREIDNLDRQFINELYSKP